MMYMATSRADRNMIGAVDPGLEANTRRFRELLTSLSARAEDFDPVQVPQSTDKQKQQEDREKLRVLASNLLENTRRLEGILRIATNIKGKRKALVAAIKYKVHYKGAIADLEKKIQNAQKILDTEFLTRIW